MASQFKLFLPVEKLSNRLANKILDKKIGINGWSLTVFATGFLSPFPLAVFLYAPSSPAILFSPFLLFLHVLGEFSLDKVESTKGERCILRRVVPFSPIILVFFWYELVLCRVIYQAAQFGFVRIINLIAIFSVIGAALLIFGFLKLKNQPLHLHHFAHILEEFSRSQEEAVPFNYLTLTFKVFKPDLFTAVIFFCCAINLYLLYILVIAASLLFLGFTIYSLFLMRIMEEFSENVKGQSQSSL